MVSLSMLNSHSHLKSALVYFSADVMKTQAQTNVGDERVHMTNRLQSSCREGKKQEQGGFLDASFGSLTLLCTTAHNHLPRAGAAHSGLCLPPSTHSQEIVTQATLVEGSMVTSPLPRCVKLTTPKSHQSA